MTTFCVVNNVNTIRSREADFDIHKDGCAALKRISEDDIYLRGSRSPEAAIAANVDDLSGDFGDEANDFTHKIHACCRNHIGRNQKTRRSSATTNKSTKEDNIMGTRTANRAAAVKKANATTKENVVKKSTAKKTTKVTKPAAPKVQKSKTVTLSEPNAKRNSVQFRSTGKDPLITAVYVSNDALALFDDGQKTIDITAKLSANQPKHSIRFDETGKERAIGSLYIMRAVAKSTALSSAKTVKVRIERAGKGVKLTVTAA